MTKFLKSFLKDESGASAAEYALILAVIGAAIVVAGLALSTAISERMQDTADCIDDTSTCS